MLAAKNCFSERRARGRSCLRQLLVGGVHERRERRLLLRRGLWAIALRMANESPDLAAGMRFSVAPMMDWTN